jgi:hypothetical protein
LRGEKEHISVHYQQTRYDVEVSTLQTLKALYDAIDAKFQIAAPFDYIYRWEDGDAVKVTDIKDLKSDHLYYIKTRNDLEPVAPPVSSQSPSPFKSMQEFYDALGAQGSNDSQIAKIRKIFDEQEIGVNVLARLTDEKLKEDGLTQRGLREAVLAVLGK